MSAPLLLRDVLRMSSASAVGQKHLAGPSRRSSLPRHRHHHHQQKHRLRLVPVPSSVCPVHPYSTSTPVLGSASSPSGTSASASASTSSASAPIQRPHPHQHPAFERLSTALTSTQPCFGARGDEVELLTSPEGFYKRLLEMVKRAKKRVIISSLYIGTEEGELVDAIRHVLASNPQLRVTFILDYHRATRLSSSTAANAPADPLPPSTAHLLLPLVESFPDRCEVWLFRSPKLRGLMEKIVPARYDEGWGTWHGKWYGVDDEVLISGANLAESYFTNRQDRYIHFRQHPSLLSYLSSLTRLFTQYSYLLHHAPPAHISPYYTVPLPNPSDPSSSSSKSAAQPGSRAYLIWPSASIHPRKFHTHALATLTAFQNSWKASNPGRSRRVDVDTWFWPVVQAGVLGVKEEERALGQVWKAVQDSYEGDTEGGRVSVDLTSGYFGLYEAYKKAVIDSPAPVNVIAASPKANGFYGSKGFSRLIPEGYTLLESRFHREAVKRGRAWDEEKGTGVRLKEWEKKGWTYHSKGLWLTPASVSSSNETDMQASAPVQPPASIQTQPQPSKPFLTFIGSSNLSTRSLTLDTELSMIMMTSSPSLRKALGAEVKALDKNAVEVGEETWRSEERKVSLLARILVALGVEGML